ncbi:hypothetical protein PF005_g3709 [Phytophthora fragariae]|uniref:Myb/SANT-like domain-containing protein n=1 Tax=Phytophthora fragariae TaxID=53985 RepID=A0A6A3Z7E7_9STRA|nr:hypothetical protein PF009_g3987 [Phytophthora fragariae]KAE9134352.1 hypothetical protein PF007_g2972 [Phytophthora fragariae]KAE9152260.1 hypothetical protein PF006_g3509 [Phytophthora fragariae]KAE9229839.1 hypothetical protein PF005_g3709 [Phytophthora fragariae]KAE9248582.1 hypothetical protein PF004_g3791 [Phytophthora fragariae]
MQPSDDAEAVASAAPPCTMPLPLALSDLIPGRVTGSTASTPAPPPAHATKTAAAPESVKAKSGRGPRGVLDPAPSLSRKGKAPARRTKWTNSMIGELLHLRFADGDVKRRLQAADTKTKKALAWQHFASVLSQSLGVALTHDHVSLKYSKLKCLFRKEKREHHQTGNTARESEMDGELWAISSDAFGGRVGISGEVLLDSTTDEEDEETDAAKDQRASKQRVIPVIQLATALQGGMEAIAAALGSRSAADENLHSLAELLEQQQDENRRY